MAKRAPYLKYFIYSIVAINLSLIGLHTEVSAQSTPMELGVFKNICKGLEGGVPADIGAMLQYGTCRGFLEGVISEFSLDASASCDPSLSANDEKLIFSIAEQEWSAFQAALQSWTGDGPMPELTRPAEIIRSFIRSHKPGCADN